MVDYIGIESIQKIVRQRGAAAFIEGLAGEIEHDYRRWNDFDKSARHAIHSPDGVIELMPTSDGHQYSFKYVNGHPKNTELGLPTVTAFGVLADVDTGYTAAAVRAHHHDRAAHRRNVGPGRSHPCPARQPRHGAHRQRRAKRVPGDCISHLLGIRELRLFDTDSRRQRQAGCRNLHAMDQRPAACVICPSAPPRPCAAPIL
jgi:ornithine cyclodeaminase